MEFLNKRRMKSDWEFFSFRIRIVLHVGRDGFRIILAFSTFELTIEFFEWWILIRDRSY